MATQTIQVDALEDETLTMRLQDPVSDTLIDSAAATEDAVREGLYVASFTNLTAGLYRVSMVDPVGTQIASCYVITLAKTGTYQAYEIPYSSVVDANVVSVAVSATQIATGLSSGEITQVRGDSWSFEVSSLGDLTGVQQIWFTAKQNDGKPDSESLLQIDSVGGLLVVDGNDPDNSSNGSIAVTDPGSGIALITLKAIESAKLPVRTGVYDIQWKDAAGEIKTIDSGSIQIIGDVSRTTS